MRRPAGANAAACNYHDRARELVEIEAPEVGATTLFLRPEQNHTAVASRRISAQIREALVSCHQPASLILKA
jgi:hypothetical protein